MEKTIKMAKTAKEKLEKQVNVLIEKFEREFDLDITGLKLERSPDTELQENTGNLYQEPRVAVFVRLW